MKRLWHQWQVRAAVYSAATTIPLLLLLTIFMPRGFAGVPYMGLVLVIFLVLFGGVALAERSLVVNLIVVGVFWGAISVIQLINPGTAPGRAERILEGLVEIGAIAGVHAAAAAFVSYITRRIILYHSKHNRCRNERLERLSETERALVGRGKALL